MALKGKGKGVSTEVGTSQVGSDEKDEKQLASAKKKKRSPEEEETPEPSMGEKVDGSVEKIDKKKKKKKSKENVTEPAEDHEPTPKKKKKTLEIENEEPTETPQGKTTPTEPTNGKKGGDDPLYPDCPAKRRKLKETDQAWKGEHNMKQTTLYELNKVVWTSRNCAIAQADETAKEPECKSGKGKDAKANKGKGGKSKGKGKTTIDDATTASGGTPWKLTTQPLPLMVLGVFENNEPINGLSLSGSSWMLVLSIPCRLYHSKTIANHAMPTCRFSQDDPCLLLLSVVNLRC